MVIGQDQNDTTPVDHDQPPSEPKIVTTRMDTLQNQLNQLMLMLQNQQGNGVDYTNAGLNPNKNASPKKTDSPTTKSSIIKEKIAVVFKNNATVVKPRVGEEGKKPAKPKVSSKDDKFVKKNSESTVVKPRVGEKEKKLAKRKVSFKDDKVVKKNSESKDKVEDKGVKRKSTSAGTQAADKKKAYAATKPSTSSKRKLPVSENPEDDSSEYSPSGQSISEDYSHVDSNTSSTQRKEETEVEKPKRKKKKTEEDVKNVKKSMKKIVVSEEQAKRNLYLSKFPLILSRTLPSALFETIRDSKVDMNVFLEDIGFSALRSVNIETLPNRLARFVVRAFDSSCSQQKLKSGVVNVTPEKIHEILGLPIGGGGEICLILRGER